MPRAKDATLCSASVKIQYFGRRPISIASKTCLRAETRRPTVAWSTFRARAAPDRVPVSASAMKCRMSTQSNICATSHKGVCENIAFCMQVSKPTGLPIGPVSGSDQEGQSPMKIFDRAGFPNPSRIRIVLAEKKLES